MAEKQYYALCVEREGHPPEIASIHLRDEEDIGPMLGISLYTAPEGKAQEIHLERYAERIVKPMPPHERVEGNLLISPVSREELIETIHPAMPSSVLVNGKKIAGSTFTATLREEQSEEPSRYPEIVGPPMPEHKETELARAEGKTVSAVEFGAEHSLPEWKHEGEAIVLHFTDGTALSLVVGSNANNLSYEFEGLMPGDIHTDLIPIWVNRPAPE